VSESVVSDSTFLIGLERVGELDILPALFDSVMIPPEVMREFGGTFSWLKVENLTNNLLVAAFQMTIDAGKVIGTVGVLIRAKQSGVIAEIKPILDALDANEFCISRALYAEALKIAGE
jgi:uncharacterized protein